MLDHLGITVSDHARSKRFYLEALAPMGYELMMDHEISGSGFGRDGKPDFWIKPGKPSGPVHVAFSASDRATVDAFFLAAVKAGAQDNGAPGPRPEYHPTYYGAFVIDPDGNNIEAVCHRP